MELAIGKSAQHRITYHPQTELAERQNATLEAHRATNRARVIRRVFANANDLDVLRLDLREPIVQYHPTEKNSDRIREQSENIAGNANTNGEVNPNSIRKLWEMWPVGSMQYVACGGSKPAVPGAGAREYIAHPLGPNKSWRISKGEIPTSSIRPWLRTSESTGGDALQRLGDEIKAFERFMTPTANELNGARQVALEVRRIIQSTLKDSTCEVTGSHSTGLAMPISDIDLSVTLPEVGRDATSHRQSLRGRPFQKIYRKALLRLQQAFRKEIDFGYKAEVVYARVPIVRAIHRRTGQEVEIQMWSGIKGQEQYTLAYLSEYPMLRSLYFVLRSSLLIRSLGLTYEGGLGSYATLVLAVNALKHGAGQYDPLDVGSQLLYILDFYARIDLYHDGFSVDPPRRFHKGGKYGAGKDVALCGIDAMAKINAHYPYLLCLQDPADPTNDLGSKAYTIKHIQETFQAARQRITRRMERWDTTTSSQSTSLLAPLLQANYRGFLGRRALLAQHDAAKLHAPGTVSAREMLEKVVEIDRRKAAESARQNSPDIIDTTFNESKPTG
ncbi:MAG: hypothetical protein Q9202_000145 [Teloschistes flavicans]